MFNAYVARILRKDGTQRPAPIAQGKQHRKGPGAHNKLTEIIFQRHLVTAINIPTLCSVLGLWLAH